MEWKKCIGQIMYSDSNVCFWMIPRAFVYEPPKCWVSSPSFDLANESWQLVIVPSDGHGPSTSPRQYAALLLWKTSGNSSKHVYNVQLALKTVSGEETHSCSGKSYSDYGFAEWSFLNLNTTYYSASTDKCGLVKISCFIEKQEDIPQIDSFPSVEEVSDEVAENEEDEKADVSEPTGVEKLVLNLKNLLLDGQNSDVVLKAADRDFRVHKNILGARSTVFASMFQHDMTEKTDGVVDIPDCTAASFEVFLEYLYTGSADMSWDNVLNLYYAADKYHVDDLKAKCVEYMKSTLSVDTFCDVMALSLRHDEFDLQKKAVHFFCENIKEIVKTVQWQKYLSENSTQGNELIIKALKA